MVSQRLLVRVVFLAFLPGAAMSEPALTPEPLIETLDDSAKIAGTSLHVRGLVERGVLDAGFTPYLDHRLEAYVAADEEFCLLIMSRNGLYHASQRAEISGAPGWVALPSYEGREGDVLRGFGTMSIGLSGLVAEDCGASDPAQAPTRTLIRARQTGPQTERYVVLALVDQHPAEIEVYRRGGGSDPVATARCEPIEVGGSYAFNVHCPLPPEAFDAGHGAFLRVDVTGAPRPIRERIVIAPGAGE